MTAHVAFALYHVAPSEFARRGVRGEWTIAPGKPVQNASVENFNGPAPGDYATRWQQSIALEGRLSGPI